LTFVSRNYESMLRPFRFYSIFLYFSCDLLALHRFKTSQMLRPKSKSSNRCFTVEFSQLVAEKTVTHQTNRSQRSCMDRTEAPIV